MRKIFYLLMACCAVFGSCTKQLNQLPPSSAPVASFFSNTSDFMQAVTGAYNQLRAYPDQSLWMGEMRSDNIVAGSDGNRDWQGINDFSPNLTNTAFIVSAWNTNFNGIYNVNTVLDALDKKGSNVTDTALRRRFGGECRFLRAFYYFQLLRLYGELPIIDHVVSAPEAEDIPRSKVEDVYGLIISDLQYAIANLPPGYTGVDVGRATSYAAKGLLGLVYLTRSGPTYNVKGPGINSNEYGQAMALFNDIIGSGLFNFISSYPAIFSYTGENNKEVIFDVQFMSSNNGADFPSMLTPTGYWGGLGLSGSYGNGYGSVTYNISRDLLRSYTTSAGGGVDTRDTFSIQHKFNSSATVVDSVNPFIKKYINIAKRGTGYNDWPINYIVMRFTDVLLMKAECILHGAGGGSQSYVDSVVNLVRQRAGVPTGVSNVDLPTLMEERRREFLGEGLRWNDLIREGMAVTTMNTWVANDSISTINKVVPQFVIYPVPNAELLVKPGLYTQNDGYY